MSECESFKYVKTVLPSDGYSCIIHVYHGVLLNKTNVMSNDGTYSKIMWCNVEKIDECMMQEKTQNSELAFLKSPLSKKDAVLMIEQGLI